MTRKYPQPADGWRLCDSAAVPRCPLLDPDDRLRLRPVLLETVVLALRRREDVYDDDPEVKQDPVRGRRPFLADRLGPLVAEPADDPVRDGRQLALRATRADHEVVGHRRETTQVQQDDVGCLLVLRQLDDSPRDVERWSLRRRGRCGADGHAVGAVGARGLGRGRRFGHVQGFLHQARYSAWSSIWARTASGTR